MPTLPKRKVGLISCSGEDFAEGLMSRLSTLKVLEELRPNDTVTICLPLFLAGDQKERSFARFFPTITIDGCSKQCAYRATQLYSAKPRKSIIISEMLSERGYPKLTSRRKLTEEENIIKDEIGQYLANLVDELLMVNPYLSTKSDSINLEILNVETDTPNEIKSNTTTCDGEPRLPMMIIKINDKETEVIGLQSIFEFFYKGKKLFISEIIDELIEKVKLYNKIPIIDETLWKKALEEEYEKFMRSKNQET